MTPNPILRRLGLADDARVVVLHADDIGMCQATLSAYDAALEFGVLSTAATMVPCPWYPSLTALYRARAGHPRLDMGVHLTLNAEWDGYRWGPLSTRDPSSGLFDAQAYLHARARGVEENASLPAVEAELRAQVQRALDDGIDVTHVDTHMLTLFHPRLIPAYVRTALAFRLPLFLLRTPDALFGSANVPPQQVERAQATLEEMESIGMPLFDHLEVLSLSDPANRLEQGKRALEAAPPGLTCFLIHPASDTPELRALAPDWRCRAADAALFVSEAWRQAVADSGVHVIGYRALRDLFRAGLGAAVEGVP